MDSGDKLRRDKSKAVWTNYKTTVLTPQGGNCFPAPTVTSLTTVTGSAISGSQTVAFSGALQTVLLTCSPTVNSTLTINGGTAPPVNTIVDFIITATTSSTTTITFTNTPFVPTATYVVTGGTGTQYYFISFLVTSGASTVLTEEYRTPTGAPLTTLPSIVPTALTSILGTGSSQIVSFSATSFLQIFTLLCSPVTACSITLTGGTAPTLGTLVYIIITATSNVTTTITFASTFAPSGGTYAVAGGTVGTLYYTITFLMGATLAEQGRSGALAAYPSLTTTALIPVTGMGVSSSQTVVFTGTLQTVNLTCSPSAAYALTLNGGTVPITGTTVTFVITANTNYITTITFSTNFTPTNGNYLVTGGTGIQYYTITFVSNGSTLRETARSGALQTNPTGCCSNTIQSCAIVNYSSYDQRQTILNGRNNCNCS